MKVTPAALIAIREELVADFTGAYEASREESQWREVGMEVPSSGSANLYDWMSDMPRLREWVGDRVLRSVAEHIERVPNRDFESTIDVRRPDIEDNQLAQYAQRARLMGLAAEEHIDENVFATLKAGLTTKGPDKQSFFSDTHKVAANVDGTGAKTNTSNILNSGETTGDPWFLIWNKMGFGPVVYQNRREAEFDDIDESTQHMVFMQNKFALGIWARRAFAYSFWQWALVSRDTLNKDNFEAAYEQMRSFRRDGKVPMGIRPTTLVVPPKLSSEARDIVLAERLANGQSNTNFNRVKLVDTEWLA